MTNGRSERLFGDNLRQNHVLGGLGCARGPCRYKAGHVGGVDIATSGEIGIEYFFQLFNDYRFEFHVFCTKIIGQIELCGRARLYADDSAV